MYKYSSLVIAAALLLSGCGSDEQKSKTQSSSTQKSSVETVTTKKVKTQASTTKVKESEAKAPTTIAPKKVVKAEDGATLFASCAGCHGAKGDKKALGKSELIGGWSATKVEEALKGYKSKKRNIHGMGAVMQSQAVKLNDKEIKLLGEYISKLH
ncbi:Cytochrome C553 (soluble cytochrome f) [hydrothermal vent metagenome]|uniref:Cytochrome C553 (Soluble cytochrome f) n=1 Tax=hydrothermal vent metagenome TaxID=652676 RepID=A0A1W1BTK4_9ZZZZ